MDGEKAVSHSKVNKIAFGQETSYIYMHLWHPSDRQRGLGSKFLRQSAAHFLIVEVQSSTHALQVLPTGRFRGQASSFELLQMLAQNSLAAATVTEDMRDATKQTSLRLPARHLRPARFLRPAAALPPLPLP
eukprot:gene43266-52884_t